MLAKIFSGALRGIQAQIIEVEVSANQGLRSFSVVGLADTAIKEAKERIGSAIKNIGLKSPLQETRKVVVNLAPASLKKEGSHYDLPIALGYLLASEQTNFNPNDKIILGELALNGDLRPIKGALSFALLASQKGFKQIILPQANVKEASLVRLSASQNNFEIIGLNNLKQAIFFLEGQLTINQSKFVLADFIGKSASNGINLDWVKGQSHSKRGLEIAVAGGHNLFLQGPPGTGKTLLAKAAISIMPDLASEELLELAQIYSASGFNISEPWFGQRPFRAPHHSASEPTIIGGGSPAKAGEITLAHRGILFLDEFPEFHRDVLESLRQPLEQGEITIQRAKTNLNLPARFFLIASANPCPCGYYNEPNKNCTCAPSQVAAYRRKMSGPLMDRMDIFCWVSSLKYEHLVGEPDIDKETMAVKQNVALARNRQKERLRGEGLFINAEMTPPLIKKHCPIDNVSQEMLRKSVDSGDLSGRGYHRVLKVARTIADLAGRENIELKDITEALSYRQR